MIIPQRIAIKTQKSRRIRVGVLSRHSMEDANAMSGTPYRACRALAEAGLDVIDVSGVPLHNGTYPLRMLMGDRQAPLWARDIRRNATRSWRHLVQRCMEPWDYRRAIVNAARLSARAQECIDAEEIDIVVGVCISTMMYSLRPDRPMIYASDTTARLINSTYPEYVNRSSAYHRACDEIERTALQKCAYFVPAAKCAAESAIVDYGLPRERVRLVEFGAHVLPEVDLGIPDAPSRDHLELSLVAADPIRKRLAFCVEVAQALKDRGWNVKLNYVGPHQAITDNNPVVNWCGRLQLARKADRIAHQEIMRRSHFMLLPSTAEAFGIAPCEAAHFGRPSVVSSAGGLPTVIQDEHTGLVMPMEASAQDYALAIERISDNPDGYRAMSAAALRRAQSTLAWPVWAAKMKDLVEHALADHSRQAAAR